MAVHPCIEWIPIKKKIKKIKQKKFRTLVYSEPEAYSEHCETSTMECFAKLAN